MAPGDAGATRRRGVAPRAFRPLSVMLTACVWACAACAPRSMAPDDALARGAAPTAEQDLASLAALVASHDRRAERLEVLESRAAVELRWRDADGDHFEPCDADLFLAKGGRGAMRLTKLGSNLLWVGGDGEQVWVFELGRSPTRATIHQGIGHGAATDAGEAVRGGEFTLLSPRSLRSLAGIEPIGSTAWSAVPIDEAAAPDAPAHDRWAVRYEVDARVVATLRFGADGLPSEVRLADRTGTPLAVARLTDPVAARADGLAVGAWPRLATRIEVDAPRSGATLRIRLDEPVAAERRAKARFFDLAALLAQLRPEEIEYIAARVPLDPSATGRDATADGEADEEADEGR